MRSRVSSYVFVQVPFTSKHHSCLTLTISTDISSTSIVQKKPAQGFAVGEKQPFTQVLAGCGSVRPQRLLNSL